MKTHHAVPVDVSALFKIMAIPLGRKVEFEQVILYLKLHHTEGLDYLVNGTQYLLRVDTAYAVVERFSVPSNRSIPLAYCGHQKALDWLSTLPDAFDGSYLGHSRPSGFVRLHEYKSTPTHVLTDVGVTKEVVVTVKVPILELVPQLKGAPVQMSSREIAALTGKEHFNVLRDIREMFKELGKDPEMRMILTALKSECTYFDEQGEERPEFLLNQELTYTLLAGYNVKLRHTIVKRWLELEAAETLGRSAAIDTLKHAVALGLVSEDRVLQEVLRLAGI
jgi:phage regulator Rha-like protein